MTMLRDNRMDSIASDRMAGASSIIAILSVGVVGVSAHHPF